LHTKFAHVTLRSAGTCDFVMKKMVPVPLICSEGGRVVLMPWERRRPHLFARPRSQTFELGPCRSFFDGPLFARSGRGGRECCNMAGVGVDCDSLGYWAMGVLAWWSDRAVALSAWDGWTGREWSLRWGWAYLRGNGGKRGCERWWRLCEHPLFWYRGCVHRYSLF
jgi:hypothetical protein